MVPYIVDNSAAAITAPEDGNIVSHPDGTLYLESLSGEALVELGEYENISVFEGDLIFEGDQLAEATEWRIGH
ncbi:hypothetical protein JCM19233_6390 [Vibrio astriarenae]|nr:hypothetical protein JCM19233_6390 [Vibrio sp. C7]